MTALMFAVKKDKFDVTKVLVGSGADVNIQEHVWATITNAFCVYVFTCVYLS